MKKQLILFFATLFLVSNCSTKISGSVRSRTINLPLADANYQITSETSAKVCSNEIGFFDKEIAYTIDKDVPLDSGFRYRNTSYLLYIIVPLLIYDIYADILSDSGRYIESSALARAIAKSNADVLLDYKVNVEFKGLFDATCVTVIGKGAVLTGPIGSSVSAPAEKKK